MSGQNNEKIRVKVDMEIKEMVPNFLKNIGDKGRVMEEALAKRDFTAIERLAHQLRGSGETYGFEEISLIGELIGSASSQKDAQAIQGYLERLRRYLENVEVE